MSLEAQVRELVDRRLEEVGHMYVNLGPLSREGHDFDELVEIWKDVCEEFVDDSRWVFHHSRPAPHAVGKPERVTVRFPT